MKKVSVFTRQLARYTMRVRMIYLLFLFIISGLSFSGLAQDRDEWFEFCLPWDDSSQNITNLSETLDPPAGKYGFLQVTPDGHFKFENASENMRFAGVVNVAISNFPEKNLAPVLAARMAKFGINLVRIHLVDVEGQYGLFENSGQNTLELSADRLDKMDYFIKCLKDKGIYFNFCIHAGRIYKEADGIPAPVTNNQAKYITLFNEEIIGLQKRFAGQTIGHLNPYTGLKYADDPALANLELTNENQLYNGWFGWQSDMLFAAHPEGIGPTYAAELDSLFNIWLKEKYTTEEALRDAWSGNKVEEEELVQNNSFENGLTGWSTSVRIDDGAIATIQVDDTAACFGDRSVRFSVQSPGTASWHIQMKTNNFSIQQNRGYKLSFYARSDRDATFNTQVMENDTWKWISNPSYRSENDWEKHTFYFTAPFSTSKLIIQFDFGLSVGNFWIDSVSVTPSAGTGLEEGESFAFMNIKRTPYAEISKYSDRRVGDNAAFYFDLEGKYINTMMQYLKDQIGVKVPVTYTNNYYGLASIYSQSRADYMDMHAYWDHPSYPNGWSNTDFRMKNKPMVKDPAGSTLAYMQLSRVENMPLVLSEYNHPYPQIYQCEAPSLLYAYGSLMDLDGILWHAYYDYMNRFSQRYQDMFFDIAMHPVMMTHQLLSVPYRMGYIQPAPVSVRASYNEQEVFDQTKYYQDEHELSMEAGEIGASFLAQGFVHGNFNADTTLLEGALSMPGGKIQSAGGELVWDGDEGLVTIDNPYWQGATGFLSGKQIVLQDITLADIQTTNDMGFASVHLIAMDSLPIRTSRNLVLLTGARMENEGFAWNATQTSLASIGGTRTLCEPVTGEISLNFASRDSFFMFRLDETGARSDTVFMADTAGTWTIAFGNNTLWYEILNDSAGAMPVSDSTTVYTAAAGMLR